jgi:hypothetical protein
MKSRDAFEAYLNTVVKERLLQSGKSQEEALFMLDIFLAASVFLTGVVERNISTQNSIQRIVSRLEMIRHKIEDARRKPNSGAVDGSPIIRP